MLLSRSPLQLRPPSRHGPERTEVAEAAWTHGLTVVEVEDWREKFLTGSEHALQTRPKDEDVAKDKQIKKL